MKAKLLEVLFIALMSALIVILLATIAQNNKQQRILSEQLHEFRLLSDGKTAQAKEVVIERPTFVDNLFHTDRAKMFAELQKMIPVVIKEELAKQDLTKKITEVNRTMFYVQGDSAIYTNVDGVATKILKIYPINKDSSVYILPPQKVEVTNVRVEPDKNDPDNVVMYWSAVNQTTGDTLKIDQAVTTRIASARWLFKLRPFGAVGATISDRSYFGEVGVLPLSYTSKKWQLELFKTQIRYDWLKNPVVETKISLMRR